MLWRWYGLCFGRKGKVNVPLTPLSTSRYFFSFSSNFLQRKCMLDHVLGCVVLAKLKFWPCHTCFLGTACISDFLAFHRFSKTIPAWVPWEPEGLHWDTTAGQRLPLPLPYISPCLHSMSPAGADPPKHCFISILICLSLLFEEQPVTTAFQMLLICYF